MALQLKRAGVEKVHPLQGGFEAWVELGLPVEPVSPKDQTEVAAQMSKTEK